MTPALPAASASAATPRAGKGAAPAPPAWSAQPPSRTAAHANTAFAGAPRIPRPPSPQAARAPALFAPSPPLAHAAQTVPQPQAIPTQTHPIHRSSIKVGNDARTLKGVALTGLYRCRRGVPSPRKREEGKRLLLLSQNRRQSRRTAKFDRL